MTPRGRTSLAPHCGQARWSGLQTYSPARWRSLLGGGRGVGAATSHSLRTLTPPLRFTTRCGWWTTSSRCAWWASTSAPRHLGNRQSASGVRRRVVLHGVVSRPTRHRGALARQRVRLFPRSVDCFRSSAEVCLFYTHRVIGFGRDPRGYRYNSPTRRIRRGPG